MLHMNSKGMAAGLIALVTLGIFVFLVSNSAAEEAVKPKEEPAAET